MQYAGGSNLSAQNHAENDNQPPPLDGFNTVSSGGLVLQLQFARIAAGLACLKELQRLDGPKLMMGKGQKLLDGMVEIAKNHGYNLKATGVPSMPYLRITDDESLTLHQKFCGACTKRGAYCTSHHNWFLSTAHTDQDIQHTWDIVDDALNALKA